MIKATDVLAQKEIEIDEEDIIVREIKSYDYILSIPHSGTLIPSSIKHHYNLGRHICVSGDLHTADVYRSDKGITIKSMISTCSLNVSRNKTPSNNPSLPEHLRHDPIHGYSVTGHEILNSDLEKQEQEYLLKFYDEYHDLVQRSINEMKEKHGFAFMLDCHSMNSIGLKNVPDPGKKRPDFTIGTLEGKSAHPKIIKAFYDSMKAGAEANGLSVTLDNLYKGGFITMKFGNPEDHVHVIQLETVRKKLHARRIVRKI